MKPLCSVDLTQSGDAVIATLLGEIDLSNVSEVEDKLAATARDAKELVVDIRELRYIDSSGFGMLERLTRKTQLRVVLTEGAIVHRAFTVTGLSEVVPIYSSIDDALA
ncbi:MAG TPA: STAS domain-containing protein [Acidimicrobiia bacterium]|jgi:anti-anti-sigma factor|nr:STAS domain-containing protein [Acidimicrobiia bacterium]